VDGSGEHGVERQRRGAFYRTGGRAGRLRGGQSSGGRWCFIKASVTEEEARGGHLMRRKRRGWDVGSVRLHPGAGGRQTAAHGADQTGGGGSGIRRWEKTPG
jgi:hypothetical protein